MKIQLISPLVYFYSEDYADDPADNCPDIFDFGHGFKLEKVDAHQVVEPLLKKRQSQDIMSDYKRSLIMDYCTHVITRDYEIGKAAATDTAKSKEIIETRRLLGLLRMALGIGKRTHLIFQDFHIKEGDDEPCFSTSLRLEGSHWNANDYYPEDGDVSYTLSDLETAKKIFNTLVDLSESYSRVFNASYYFETARLKGDGDYRLRFTLLVTSLESIFNTGANQISETLAIRYTHLMFDDPEVRLNTYKNIKEIYRLRSYIIHGQQIPKKYLSVELQDKLIGDLEFHTRNLLNHIFSNDLVETINSPNAEDYFTRIVLGEK